MLRITIVALLVVSVASAWSFAGSVAVDRAPDPVKAVRKAAKDFLRLTLKKGYSTSVSIAGGMAASSDHKILDQAVEEDYSGLVRGMLMHMPEDKIFRTIDKGALFDGDIWRVLQSTAEGKKLDRLFAFPERLLSEAARKHQKVEWLASKEKPSEEVREGTTGKTTVAGREENRLYHRLRVTLPEKTALKYFIEVQNSGCLSGG